MVNPSSRNLQTLPRKRSPVISSYGEGNTAIRTERWRYIRYEDGSEELYDHASRST